MARRKAASTETPQAPVAAPESAVTAPMAAPPASPSPDPRIERFGSITRINH